MGYDINRFKILEISDEFICSICHDVLQNPLVIDPCDHTFCSDCINRWIIEQENCPVDRESIKNQTPHKPFRLFMNLLNELEINCDFLENGCEQYVKLGELALHTDKCSFNPKLPVLCDCGQSIAKNELLHHQNDCVDHLKMQLSGALDLVNSMNTKIKETESDLKEARKEITVFSEWDRIDEIKCIKTTMSEIMKKRLIKVLQDSLNERNFDMNKLEEKFSEEFGGNWDISYGIDFKTSISNRFSLIKIGKISVLISMSIKPVNDVLIVDKFMKILNVGLMKKVWSEDLTEIWGKLHSLSDDSLNISERLLDKNIMNYFIQYFQNFPDSDKVLCWTMIGVFANISDFSELRGRLMEKEFLRIILRLLSHPDHSHVYVCCQLLANILSESKQFWEKHLNRCGFGSFENYLTYSSIFNRDKILAQMKTKISEWKMNKNYGFSFITFKPLNRLLRCNAEIPQEVHYFAVWSLAYYTRFNCKRSCNLLREDGCIPVLQELIRSSKTAEYVKKLANLVLFQSQLFSEYGNLDKIKYSDTA